MPATSSSTAPVVRRWASDLGRANAWRGAAIHPAFRERFVEKGRLRDYLGPIPTYVVTHELPAFLGLKAVLDQG